MTFANSLEVKRQSAIALSLGLKYSQAFTDWMFGDISNNLITLCGNVSRMADDDWKQYGLDSLLNIVKAYKKKPNTFKKEA